MKTLHSNKVCVGYDTREHKKPSKKHYYLKLRTVLGFPVLFQKGCQPIMPKLLRFRPFCFLKQKHWAAIW